MKIAVVCDSMSAYGGAERVIEQILKIYPCSDIFALLDLVPKAQRSFLDGRTIHTSLLQKLPMISRYYRALLQFWPLAIEQLNVSSYDLIISSHHSVAYGVLTRPGQVHVSYVHSPMRYAWDLQHEYLGRGRLNSGLPGLLARQVLHKTRIWDYTAAQRPDAIATNSFFVKQRLWQNHRRRARVIYPPVAVDRFQCMKHDGGYYLSFGRLVPYKRVDLVARAFARMPERRLKIVGEGPDLGNIAAISPANVDILGYQSSDRVLELLAGARAYIFAGIEDFGISAVEAQASGTPVIAYRGGGLLETVNGLESALPTGVFFTEQTEAAIAEAVELFERNGSRFTAEECIANARRFGDHRFRDEFATFVSSTSRRRWSLLPASGQEMQRGSDDCEIKAKRAAGRH